MMSAAPPKPNIVFIFSDQQRWDTVGAYGQKLPVTPNIDALAAAGVRFRHSFTCQPVCGPARACLMTGRYATETGCFVNGIALPRSERTIAHHLAGAGYETGYIGKWHLASTINARGERIDYSLRPVPPELRGGYDFWLAADVLEFTSHSYDGHVWDRDGRRVDFPEGRYRADVLGEYAVDYIRTRTLEKPFFLFLSFIEPHHQNDHNRYEGPVGSKERFGKYEVPGDLAGTRGDWRESFPDYLGCCNAIDASVGRICDALRERGIERDTLIIYTSDHGSHFCTRNSEYKRSCHDASIRTPLVMCGPGWRGGAVVDELVSLIDLPPTVLAAAGVAPPPSMRGRPLQQLLGPSPAGWPSEVFVQISEDVVGRAVRTKKWKYAVAAPGADPIFDSGSDVYDETYLYDLEADPHERTNLAADARHAAVRKDLADILRRRMAGAGEAVPQIRPARSA